MTEVIFRCDGTRVSFLLILLLTSYHHGSHGTMVEIGETFTSENGQRPEITTPQGKVRGMNMVTRHNRTVFGFVGIPYAQPPIENLRFAAPLPSNPWNGTLEASRDTNPCPQLNDDGTLVGDEDCLHLNVYTPQLPTCRTVSGLPVMLYVIGGSFTTENNSFGLMGPDYLLDEDVILVVPNFRVGVLGYLTTGDAASPGNYGLKDVVQALRWTRENIEYFGGDPDKVTLVGGSSGGTSVQLLALSNLPDELFHRCVMQSGTALTMASPREVYTNRTLRLGEYLGCPTDSSTVLVDCLRSRNVSELLNAESIFHEWHRYPITTWAPTYEPDVEGALFTESPADLLAAGKIRDIPSIFCVTRDEGLLMSVEFYENRELFDEFFANVDSILPIMLDFRYPVDNVTAYTNALKSYYLNDLTADRNVLLNNVTQLFGDASFVHPLYESLQKQAIFSKSPQYFCSFEYRGTFSHTYQFSDGLTEYTGVTHGDETLYLFQAHDSLFGPPCYKNDNADWKMVDTMVQLWTSFVINGTPTTREACGVVWEPYSSRDNYLRIGNGFETSLEVKYNYLEDRMRFWKEIS